MSFAPNAPTFSPKGVNGTQQKRQPEKQVSTHASPNLEARIFSLEEDRADLRGDVRSLEQLYEGLSLSVEKLKTGGCSARPREAVDVSESYQNALQLKTELEKLKSEVHTPVYGDDDDEKANGLATVKVNASVPPHLRASSAVSNGTITESILPHLRTKLDDSNGTGSGQSVNASPKDTRNTNGQVDGHLIPAPNPSPPVTPKLAVQDDTSTIKLLSLEPAWKPYYIRTLPALDDEILSRIPHENMVTFDPEFIQVTLRGESWSPGLHFMSGPGPYVLRNRTYYILNPQNEPFLPSAPGQHGAKLTAFFKESPETFHSDFDHDACSYANVPMFVETKGCNGRFRYLYYGNYSQTRWSDKLDHDTMMTKVPPAIKSYWAEELTSAAREDWLTEELKRHLFPQPEYTGALFAAHADNDDATSVATAVEVKANERMARDVRSYVEALREWDREARMKTALVKKQVVLDAFEASDADEAPALRLWWEYLECVDWRRDFYDLLVTLQSRNEEWVK